MHQALLQSAPPHLDALDQLEHAGDAQQAQDLVDAKGLGHRGAQRVGADHVKQRGAHQQEVKLVPGVAPVGRPAEACGAQQGVGLGRSCGGLA